MWLYQSKDSVLTFELYLGNNSMRNKRKQMWSKILGIDLGVNSYGRHGGRPRNLMGLPGDPPSVIRGSPLKGQRDAIVRQGREEPNRLNPKTHNVVH